MGKRQDLLASWEEPSKKPKMLLAHFSKDELQALDSLQEGSSLDPATDIKEYSKLSQIFKIPKIRKIFLEVKQLVAKDIKEDGQLDPPLKTIDEESTDILPPFQNVQSDKLNPLAKELKKEGTGGDTELAWIPEDVASFFIEINNGQIKINPSTKLLMFGGFFSSVGNVFKSVVKIASPIVGGLLGGPLGAAAGAALGTVVTGGKSRDIMKNAIMGGATHGLGNWAAGATGWSPALAHGLARGAIGVATGEGFKDAALQGITHGAAHQGVGKIGQAIGLTPSATNAATGIATAAAPASQGLGAGIGNFFKNPSLSGMGLLPLAAMGALSYQGQKEAFSLEKQRRQEAKQELEQTKRDMGYYEKWQPHHRKDVKLRKNPGYFSQPLYARQMGAYDSPYLEDFEEESIPFPAMPYESYYKGGHVKNPEYHDQSKVHSLDEGVLVKGPGKGQQDLIKTSVPENSYIIDASTTSMFGDGSSDAGARILKEFEEEIKEKFPSKQADEIAHHLHATTRQLPVWLSDSEYKFDPLTVTLLGNGSSKKGAKMLKQMVEKIRAEKSKKGGGLPLKAKSPWYYLDNKR